MAAVDVDMGYWRDLRLLGGGTVKNTVMLRDADVSEALFSKQKERDVPRCAQVYLWWDVGRFQCW
jgi:hypothetical protein